MKLTREGVVLQDDLMNNAASWFLEPDSILGGVLTGGNEERDPVHAYEAEGAELLRRLGQRHLHPSSYSKSGIKLNSDDQMIFFAIEIITEV